MSILDSKDGTLSIYRLVILDAVIILLLGWLIADNVVPLRPTTLIGYPALLIFNFVFLWKAHCGNKLPKRTTKLPKRMWSVAVVFTAAAVVEIVYWIRSPDVRSTVQAIGGTALAAWMWYLAVDRRPAKRED
jgi:hypothetical protein